MIETREPKGDPGEMNEDEALALLRSLPDLIHEISADRPCEPGDSPFDRLMHFVCVEGGYCGSVKADGTPLHVTRFIPE